MVTRDYKAEFAEYQLKELRRAPGTVKLYRHYLRALERDVGKPAQDITAEDLRLFKRSSPLASQTIKGRMVAVRQFHLWGVLEGYWEPSTLPYVRTPRVFNDSLPPLSNEVARQLLAACSRPLEYRLIYLGLYAGTRIGESAMIAGPMWEDGVLRFKGEKTGKERVIPIHPELEEAKWMILANPPPYETVLQKVKRRLEKRVGIRFVAHQLRKTFATEIYEAGTPDEVVAELLGHTGSVTRLYAPVTTRMRVEAIQLLDYGNGIRPTSLNAKSRPSRKPVQAVELPRAHGSAAIASVTPITSITRAANNPVDSLDDRRKLILNRLKDIDPKAATLVLRYLRSRPAAGHQHRCLRVLGTNIKKWYLFDIDKLMWHWTGSELPAASPTCKLNYRVVPDPVAATVWASLIASAAVMCKPCFRKTTEPPHHLLHHSLSSIDPRWEETMQSLRDIPW